MPDPANAPIRPGTNIAIKIPMADDERTLSFQRNTLGLTVTAQPAHGYRSHTASLGHCTLHLDEFASYGQSEVWLELLTPDLATAVDHLRAQGFTTCDEVEPLPAGLKAHWIRSPAGVIHLLREQR